MRIALVITELDPGGAERCLTELAIYLSQRGHQVLVLAIGPLPASPYDALVQRLTAVDVQVRSGNAHGMASAWQVIRWLRAELDAFAPDLVQAMLWHANVLSALALRGRRATLLGGMRVSEPRRWRWSLERWAARRMASVVCVSEDVRKHALTREHLPAEKLVVIPNGVRLGTGDPAKHCEWSELGEQRPEHVLLFVGRLEPQKGVLQLAEHASDLLEGLSGWSLVFMGKGNLRSQLQAVIARQALTDHVHIVGWQPQAERWMADSDIVLLPAQYEGMPNALLEAMAVGKPFVAFSVDGVAQLLTNDYPDELARAQLASPGNWNDFIDRVRNFANDSKLRQACGEANRAQVTQHFRLEDQLAKYEALYKVILHRGGAETGENAENSVRSPRTPG